VNEQEFASFDKAYREGDRLNWTMAVRQNPEGAYQFAMELIAQAEAKVVAARSDVERIQRAAQDEARRLIGVATDRAAEVRGRLRQEVAEFIAAQMFPAAA